MSNKLTHLRVKNFRSLANIDIELSNLNILFGSNGSGKSTFLDAICFIGDCQQRGVEFAASQRNFGVGALWDGAGEDANISIEIETEEAIYEILLGFSSGRIEPSVGERLYSKFRKLNLLTRKMGSNKATVRLPITGETQVVKLRDTEKLSLDWYAGVSNAMEEATSIDDLLMLTYFYHSRSVNLNRLKRRGSESISSSRLVPGCENLWSVLRNFHDRRRVDKGYDTIVEFMREAFPSFDDILFEHTSPMTVYGSFLEKGRRNPIQASGVADGYIQMLINLTPLFSYESLDTLILFDEPEISLHPWAIATFAKAVKLAASSWNKQIFIATHSPVLMSQFNPENILVTEVDEIGQTAIRRVSEMEEVQDLLEEYAIGSLYMSEAIAPQSKPLVEGLSR
jgi:predicted ATPase